MSFAAKILSFDEKVGWVLKFVEFWWRWVFEKLKMSKKNKPEVVAHLMLLFLQSGQMLHASGKFVPSLVSQISDQLESPEDGEVLKKYQALVIDKMHLKAEDQDKLSDIQKQLEELTPKVKLIAANVKKPKN